MSISFHNYFFQLESADIIFQGVTEGPKESPNLMLLDLPCPAGCPEPAFIRFKEQILNCTMHLDTEMAQWVLTYSFKRPVTDSCLDVRHHGVTFEYGITTIGKEKKDSFLADRLLADLKGLFMLYEHALNVDGYLKGFFFINILL